MRASPDAIFQLIKLERTVVVLVNQIFGQQTDARQTCHVKRKGLARSKVYSICQLDGFVNAAAGCSMVLVPRGSALGASRLLLHRQRVQAAAPWHHLTQIVQKAPHRRRQAAPRWKHRMNNGGCRGPVRKHSHELARAYFFLAHVVGHPAHPRARYSSVFEREQVVGDVPGRVMDGLVHTARADELPSRAAVWR